MTKQTGTPSCQLFWCWSFLTPLIAWKTQTNIGKQLCISKYPTQDPKSTKICHWDQILGLKMALSQKIDFWPFLWCDMAICKPKICSQWQIMVLLVVTGCSSDVPSCFPRFPGPLVAKKWKKLKKKCKN